MESHPPLIFKWIFSTMYEEGISCIHTSSPMPSRVRGVFDNITYHGASTISLSFWLSCFLHILSGSFHSFNYALYFEMRSHKYLQHVNAMLIAFFSFLSGL